MDRREFVVSSMGAAISASQSWGSKSSDQPNGTIVVGDDRLQLRLNYGPGGLEETAFQVYGERFTGLAGLPWNIRLNERQITPKGASVRLVAKDELTPTQSATFEGSIAGVRWALKYHLSGAGRITKTLSLTPTLNCILQRASLWNVHSGREPQVVRTKLQDIAAFYRQGSHGIFASLDFPFSQIRLDNGITDISYPPFDSLNAAEEYVCHPLTFGAVQLAGVERYGYDLGEVAAMDAYVQERYPPRFNRPMFASSCINNRYTQVRNGVVFYTMKDNPTLNFHPDLLRREMALMPKLGIEYYQLFPGVFDWGPDDPSPKAVHSIADYGRSLGLRVGGYSATTSVFVAHYNQYRNRLNRPDWKIKNEKGEAAGNIFCFGVAEFVRYYINTVVPASRKYGYEIHCLDGLDLTPCYATDHGHPPGPESLYSEVRGLVQLMEALDAVSPQMMTWSNAGNWQELLPKLAWSNHNLYLTDPGITTPWQGLNMTRLLDDARREQMVSLHYTHFLPYRFYTNLQYFFCQNSIVPDIRNFKYGVLSSIAVAPNLGLGEVRPWLDQLPAVHQEDAIRFYKEWTGFLKQHYDLWKHTFHAGENPGVGSVEIYGHAAGNRGFIFLVNPQYWDRTVEVSLDSTLGFDGSGECEVCEIYPTKRLRLTAQGPFVMLGTKLAIRVPAQEVLVLELRPAPERVESPLLYGLPGTIEPVAGGYQIKTQGQQGHAERFAILLPPGNPTIAAARVLPDVPKQDKRLWAPTPLRRIAASDKGVWMEVTFRRKSAPTQLRDWQVRPGDLSEGEDAKWSTGLTGKKLEFPLFVDVDYSGLELPLSNELADKLGLGPLANFCGAFIDNAFSEMEETWIELKTGNAPALEGPLGSGERVFPRGSLDSLARDPRGGWWLQTDFYLPFINSDGTEPAFDEHPYLVLPLVRQERLKQVHAWINGTALPVRSYHYPRNPRLACQYADLLNSGARGEQDNMLIVHLQY